MHRWFNIHKSINVIQYINRSKDIKRLITSIDAKKAFNKIQKHFMIKALRIKGMYLNILRLHMTNLQPTSYLRVRK
jgi:GTP-binding protein EngB required for normal cell division